MTVIVGMSKKTMLQIMAMGTCLLTTLGGLRSERNCLRVDSLALLFDVEAKVPR